VVISQTGAACLRVLAAGHRVAANPYGSRADATQQVQVAPGADRQRPYRIRGSADPIGLRRVLRQTAAAHRTREAIGTGCILGALGMRDPLSTPWGGAFKARTGSLVGAAGALGCRCTAPP
jgi:hypothetical protein